MLKLGTFVKDKASKQEGMLTVYMTDESHNAFYCFQPKGLNPETMVPLDTIWLDPKRILDGQEDNHVELPLNLLGTEVEDIATGFKGTAISLFYYQNGCTHFEVKPTGVIEKTGETIKAKEFDMRRLRGEAITALSAEELQQSKLDKPSPEYHPSFLNR